MNNAGLTGRGVKQVMAIDPLIAIFKEQELGLSLLELSPTILHM